MRNATSGLPASQHTLIYFQPTPWFTFNPVNHQTNRNVCWSIGTIEILTWSQWLSSADSSTEIFADGCYLIDRAKYVTINTICYDENGAGKIKLEQYFHGLYKQA